MYICICKSEVEENTFVLRGRWRQGIGHDRDGPWWKLRRKKGTFHVERRGVSRSRNLEMAKLRECSGESKFLISECRGVWKEQRGWKVMLELCVYGEGST